MCKTRRKINKINFNKFIWLYWKIKIYIYIIYFFSGGFPVARMREKKNGALRRKFFLGFTVCKTRKK